MLHRPSLREPVMIVGFGGWPNAGEVSTWVVTYLIRTLGATRCAEIKPDLFFDLCQQRPVVSVEEGFVRCITFPCNVFYSWNATPPAKRDLVLFVGQEPHLQWPGFVEAFLDVAQRLGVVEIFTIGGVYDNIPHTVQPPITGLVNQAQGTERLSSHDIQFTNYEGPMSIHSYLLVAAGHRMIPATSIWGHVPYYVQSNNAKTCLAVLERLQRMAGFELDLGDVRKAAELLDAEIDRIIEGKPELREYIRGLEREYASGAFPSNRPTRAERPQSPGEKIIRIDPFLRRS